jgi:hypothetical protein
MNNFNLKLQDEHNKTSLDVSTISYESYFFNYFNLSAFYSFVDNESGMEGNLQFFSWKLLYAFQAIYNKIKWIWIPKMLPQ